MQEQRLTLRLLRYWELIRKNNRFPEMAHLNIGAIEEVWPYCFRVHIDHRRKTLSYKYEYMGEPVAKLYGQDLTGTVVDHNMKDFPGSVIVGKLSLVVEGQKPVLEDGHMISGEGKLVKYRACLLPFGTEKKGLTHIVVGLSCRYF